MQEWMSIYLKRSKIMRIWRTYNSIQARVGCKSQELQTNNDTQNGPVTRVNITTTAYLGPVKHSKTNDTHIAETT